ncbi:MAG: MarR family transcriptional regulator [Candidatus Eremiobacteraeota bacterium]|nr:MarR family transcriptional regulator [Candidatus Eremiobacteraeota bacterium]
MSDFVAALRGTVRALRAEVDRMLTAHGLRLGQYQLLRVLWERDGQTPRELAEAVGVEMPTVTRTVQRMVRDGFVRREAHPRDARSVRIFVTQKGRDAQAVASQVLQAGTERALSGFSAAEQAELTAQLERIRENLAAD